MNDKASQCDNCGEYLCSSTVQQIRINMHECTYCGHINEPNRELIDVIADQEHEIEEMHKLIRNLAKYSLLLAKLGLGGRLTTKEQIRSVVLRSQIENMAESNDESN